MHRLLWRTVRYCWFVGKKKSIFLTVATPRRRRHAPAAVLLGARGLLLYSACCPLALLRCIGFVAASAAGVPTFAVARSTRTAASFGSARAATFTRVGSFHSSRSSSIWMLRVRLRLLSAANVLLRWPRSSYLSYVAVRPRVTEILRISRLSSNLVFFPLPPPSVLLLLLLLRPLCIGL